MIASVSYHAPTSALPKAGLAASVSVLTTIRSMISPGICELSNSSVAPGNGRDLGEERVPGHHVLDVLGAGEHRDDVGVGGVDDGHVLLGQARLLERAGQQVVGDAELDQVDALPVQLGHRLGRLADDAVIAVGEVADDQRRAVDAAHRRDGQRVHVGHHAAVEAAGGVLVDRFDVVVDLHDLDLDAVLVGPFLDDALVRGPAPRHPPDIDRPGDLEAVLGLGRTGDGQQDQRQRARSIRIDRMPISRSWRRPGSGCGLVRNLAPPSAALLALPGFCPAVAPRGCSRAGVRLSDQTPPARGRNPRRVMPHPAARTVPSLTDGAPCGR